jgi:hypothetical protein
MPPGLRAPLVAGSVLGLATLSAWLTALLARRGRLDGRGWLGSAVLASGALGVAAGWLARAMVTTGTLDLSAAGLWRVVSAATTEPPIAALATFSTTRLGALSVTELALAATVSLCALRWALASPLCRSCYRWGSRRVTARLGPASRREVAAHIERRDFVWLDSLGASQCGRGVSLTLDECDCGQTRALSLALRRPLRDRVAIVRNLRLGDDAARTVSRIVARAPTTRISGLRRPRLERPHAAAARS